MKKLLLEAFTLCAIIGVVRYGFAQTWTKTSAKAFALSLGISADGLIIVSFGSDTPLVSTNGGVTWITPFFTPAPSFPPQRVASSADGTKMIVFGSNVVGTYVSQDSGISWFQVASPSQNLSVVAISADGNTLFAGANGGSIFKSTNFGTNWVATRAPSNTWRCIALSTDGIKLAAGTTGGTIFTSTNSGLTWMPTTAPTNDWTSIASSSDGSRLVAATGGNIYISTNSGGSWTPVGVPGYAVASSADGSKLIVVAIGNGVYMSTNFGVNWASTNIAYAGWNSVASSADGNELVAGGGGGIWMYQVTPSPRLNLVFSNNNLSFSWLIPSTNFVLQQNLDLTTTNWLTLTNVPTLNFANLNNELTLSSSNSSGFYRLATP
ncbi:MAG TPA: hypothetical protein VG077_01555 [Verrucomicrobiae bacterium]|nr:hypothetical protein [Verrucomicrobiae bacterium]